MLRIVVIENDEIQCKEMSNKISKAISNAKICGIFYNVNEAILTIIEDKIDIVIFDEDKQSISCEEFLNVIRENYNKDVIFISKKRIVLKYKKSIDICSQKLSNNEIIDKIISKISYKNKELIIEKIKKELEKLNFNFSHIGTSYLVIAIYETYKLQAYKNNINLSKDIFPTVGKTFNKSANTIHSGIKREVINMYCGCEENIIKKYFNFYCYEESPKLKEMIFEIISKINNII